MKKEVFKEIAKLMEDADAKYVLVCCDKMDTDGVKELICSGNIKEEQIALLFESLIEIDAAKEDAIAPFISAAVFSYLERNPKLAFGMVKSLMDSIKKNQLELKKN